MNPRKLSLGLPLAAASLLLATPASAEVTFDWVTVGNPGNAADTFGDGAVAYVYRISETEVSNAQYAEFLNAVAATDTNDLYDTSMGSGFGGITRSGSSGSFTYSAIAGRENMPVNFVDFYDSLRFANWLHNGQPTGAQANGTTESGAYTITAAGIAANSITRNAWGTIFLPDEDEWYKAAYYDAVSANYFFYPTGTDTEPTCAVPGATANTANCDLVVGDLTIVGSYTGSASPSGTFDQGGNALEWTETIFTSAYRIARGGEFEDLPIDLSVIASNHLGTSWEFKLLGFRVASPVPPVPSLSPLGIALLSSLLGLAGWRKLRR